jgi:hypothetical protein
VNEHSIEKEKVEGRIEHTTKASWKSCCKGAAGMCVGVLSVRTHQTSSHALNFLFAIIIIKSQRFNFNEFILYIFNMMYV